MKKTAILLLCIMFLFIPVMVFQHIEASVNGKLLKHDKAVLDRVSQTTNTDYVEDIIVLPSSDVQVEEVVKMIERVSAIHPNILEKVVDNNVRLKLFNGSLTDQVGFTHLKGVKPRGYVRYTWDVVPGAGGSKLAMAKIGHSVKGKGHGSINLELHELAHSIDRHVFHSLRKDPVFLEIWKREASLIFPEQPYFINHPEEFFAESFAMFYLSPTTRKELIIHAPDTYYFIKGLETREEHKVLAAIAFK